MNRGVFCLGCEVWRWFWLLMSCVNMVTSEKKYLFVTIISMIPAAE